ncbi:MAG TPA: hypothetical protein EYH45_01275 [Candidatus Caldiarchaeum subterraneum]|uniref:DUF2029 domain-containing protein n=1 Tax=Caldiarchaeum subterraneum TaxID=311458 RepID=A0A833E9X0_CALS0|nr:hypothetical protein [Candidatus Caldarchaeum subterraneum]
MNRNLQEIISAAIMVFTLSYFIHHPTIPNKIYSDIVAFYTQRPSFAEGKIPYIEFEFEYPPLSGFLSYLCVKAGGSLTSYYNCFSGILLIFTLALSVTAYGISRLLKRELSLIYLLLLPSMIIYLVYNYDIIFSFFILLSLYFYYKKRYLASGMALGFSIVTKLMGFILIPVLIRGISREGKLAILSAAVIIPVVVNGILALVNYDVWIRTYLYHVEWGLENSWLVNFFQDPETWDTAKAVSLLMAGYMLLRVYTLNNIDDKVIHSLIVLNVWLLTTYVYTPQMNLWVLPFYAILGRTFPLIYAYELANALIILTWFISPNPTAAFSIPQIISTVRALILAILTLQLAYVAGVFKPKLEATLARYMGKAR